MAFLYTNWQRWSASFDLENNTLWNYSDPLLTGATIAASGFFNSVNNNADSPVLNINDLIYVEASDVNQFYQVTAISPNVTVSAFQITIGTGAVGTTNLANGAVTTAKIAANAVDVAELALDTIQYVKVPVTAAQFKGAYAAPFVLIAAPGAGKMIVVDDAQYVMTFVAAQYTAGGVLALQYDSTVHGAGTLASATVAAATVNAWAVSSNIGVAGALANSAITTVQNKGLYLSNDTAAFATGDGTFEVHIAYRIVTA